MLPSIGKKSSGSSTWAMRIIVSDVNRQSSKLGVLKPIFSNLAFRCQEKFLGVSFQSLITLPNLMASQQKNCFGNAPLLATDQTWDHNQLGHAKTDVYSICLVARSQAFFWSLNVSSSWYIASQYLYIIKERLVLCTLPGQSSKHQRDVHVHREWKVYWVQTWIVSLVFATCIPNRPQFCSFTKLWENWIPAEGATNSFIQMIQTLFCKS